MFLLHIVFVYTASLRDISSLVVWQGFVKNYAYLRRYLNCRLFSLVRCIYAWNFCSTLRHGLQTLPPKHTDSLAFLVPVVLAVRLKVKGKDIGFLCLPGTPILYLCVLNSRAAAPGLLLLLLLRSPPSCIWLDERGSEYLSKGCERRLICDPALPVGKHGGARELAVIAFGQQVNTTVQKSWQKATFSPPDLGVAWKVNKSFPAKSFSSCVTPSPFISCTVTPDPWWDAWTHRFMVQICSDFCSPVIMALSALRCTLAIRFVFAISVALGFGMQREGAKLGVFFVTVPLLQ